jgi:hypothetical protein
MLLPPAANRVAVAVVAAAQRAVPRACEDQAAVEEVLAVVRESAAIREMAVEAPSALCSWAFPSSC